MTTQLRLQHVARARPPRSSPVAASGRARNGSDVATVLVASPVERLRREWLEALQGRFRAVELGAGSALTEAVEALRPVVLLLDAGVSNLRLVIDLRSIRRASPHTAIIVLADPPRDDQALAALRLGVRGYCSAQLPALLVRRAVEKVQRGELWISRQVTTRLLEAVSALAPTTTTGPLASIDAGLALLSQRQREVALLVAQGHKNRSIAANLAISEATVKAHMTMIFQKLGAPTRVELALHLAGAALHPSARE